MTLRHPVHWRWYIEKEPESLRMNLWKSLRISENTLGLDVGKFCWKFEKEADFEKIENLQNKITKKLKTCKTKLQNFFEKEADFWEFTRTGRR